MPSFKTVAVIGAGAWGTALAGVAARAGRDVVLYARSSATAAEIAATRSNPKLPGAKLAASIKVTDDIAGCRGCGHRPDRNARAEFCARRSQRSPPHLAAAKPHPSPPAPRGSSAAPTNS